MTAELQFVTAMQAGMAICRFSVYNPHSEPVIFSLYPISSLSMLIKDTRKYESHFADRLLFRDGATRMVHEKILHDRRPRLWRWRNVLRGIVVPSKLRYPRALTWLQATREYWKRAPRGKQLAFQDVGTIAMQTGGRWSCVLYGLVI